MVKKVKRYLNEKYKIMYDVLERILVVDCNIGSNSANSSTNKLNGLGVLDDKQDVLLSE